MKKIKFQKLKKLLPGLKKNVSLKNQTTFKIGGPAKYFYEANKKEDLIKAILVARKIHPVRDYRNNKKAQRKQISNGVHLPFFVLGGGSNLLVSDKGFNGLIIKAQNTKYKILNTKIVAEAGTMLSQLVNVTAGAGLSGLEWAVGIPGTVGGAIYGNAGAFGNSMADIIKAVEVFDTKESRIKNYELRDCKFSYRDSIFKHANSATLGLRPRDMRMRPCEYPNLIILSATLQLKKRDKVWIKNKIQENLNYRKETQPLNFPSAGSIFKNKKLKIKNKKLLKEFPELKEFNKKGQIPAGWLIEKAGLKGKRIGNVKISEKHANFIVNLGRGKAKEVKKLIKLIKSRVKRKFKVVLKEEIEYLGL